MDNNLRVFFGNNKTKVHYTILCLSTSPDLKMQGHRNFRDITDKIKQKNNLFYSVSKRLKVQDSLFLSNIYVLMNNSYHK